MIRKQIYIEEIMIKQIKELAEQKNNSQSELIRNSILEYIKKEQLKGEIKDPLLELIGIIDIPEEDASENHDINLYGVKSDG